MVQGSQIEFNQATLQTKWNCGEKLEKKLQLKRRSNLIFMTRLHKIFACFSSEIHGPKREKCHFLKMLSAR